jgi:hypothetical protein
MGWCHPRQLAILDASKASTGRAVSKPSDADAYEPPVLSGEVVTPTRTNGERHRRSAAIYSNHGLTWKQNAFCEAVVFLRCNNTAAYRRSYDVSRMKNSTVWVRAAELARNSKVRVRIQELAAQELQTASDLRDFAISRLRYEALNATSDAARVRALRTLLTMSASASQSVADPKALRSELEERLDALLPHAGSDD